MKTLVWNGPFGAFELEPFDIGTIEVAEAAAELTAAGKPSNGRGGGDTVAALNAAEVTDRFTYVSTAGGAFLEWLEGKALPRVEVLRGKMMPAITKSSVRPLPFGSGRRQIERVQITTKAAMNLAELNKVAEAMVAPGRGILAADESSGRSSASMRSEWNRPPTTAATTASSCFARRAMSKCISGSFSTTRPSDQNAKDGTPLVKVIEKAGVLSPASRSTRAPSRCRSRRGK